MASQPLPQLGPGDAVLAVDVQRDFCPGGALPVAGGDRVVPVLNEWIRQAARSHAVVVASRDWHPRGHMSFVERGGPWPVHCVQESRGAQFHPDLDLPGEAILISKGEDPDREQYSAFDGTGLASLLERRGVRRIFIGGLAQDVCVRACVLDALEHGFETHLLLDATFPVDESTGARAVREMRDGGAIIEGDDRPGGR